MTQQDKIAAILEERGKTHGKYSDVAKVWVALMNSLQYERDHELDPGQRLALNVICQKLARIECGNENFDDHWDDIAGYALCVVRELEAQDCMEGYFVFNAGKTVDDVKECLTFINYNAPQISPWRALSRIVG